MTDTERCEPPPEWEATCGVCGSLYGWNSDDEPPAHGVFCNHCRSNGQSAPGVLHFARVPAVAPVTPPVVVAALVKALEGLVMACELPGDHCEVEQALPAARAALALYRGEAGR